MSAVYNPLARFRADPVKVRVSVRQSVGGWVATVTPKDRPECSVSAFEPNPAVAVIEALEAADAEDFPGIDLGMEWAYDHPWRKAAA